ncbi:uncharacterized protein LOC113306033 [Papaver somniferum]|uniref:uncharacterized protein LOC113306033 n=1 Tax=Papaver somniferum TaxID=3469 RepID=UPI000E6FB684|nr:uncharacterized protein LOC113306033 [Papaver somniferum]
MEFGDIQMNINKLQKDLEFVQNDISIPNQHDRVKSIVSELENWYKIQFDFYKEKSRDKSLFEMDNNTRYFHSIVKKRLHTNNINALCDTNGNWLRGRHDISTLLRNHFSDVAITSNPILPENAFDIFPRIILDADNVVLTTVPSEHEIENVVKHMPAWSAPGPDGFKQGFTKHSGNLLILANRIRPFLKKLISPYQTAFVPGRAIYDNIITAHEVIHSMKHKEGLSGTVELKLDLSKAFDRLEWNFLIKVLDSFGFSKEFCNLIIQCVSITSISMLLNGSPCDQFKPTRGIRQGDPLSPYLFILAMEYLSRSLLVAETNKSITGIKVSRKSLLISHLFFADDILIFGQANMQHLDHILHTLQEFGKLSGQILNFDKSCVYFIKNLSPNDCANLARALNMYLVSDSEKYLGAPLLLGHSKIKFVDLIIQSFEARLNNYIGTTINQAGRSTLIKIGKGIKFIAWDSINILKELGGLGFINLETFNIALICKLVWKILTAQEELWVQIMNSKNIYKCIEIIKRNSIWAVRCGTKVNIWLDNWVIGLDHPPSPAEGLINTVSYIHVSDLFIQGTRDWNIHPVYYLFSPESAESILCMTIPAIGTDNLICMPDRKVQFSVKSAYNVLSSYSNTNTGAHVVPVQVRKALWKFKLPHKVKLFAWKCIRDIVPTRDKLSKYKPNIELHCSLWNHPNESMNHMLLDCPYARSVWLSLNINVGNIMLQHGSLRNWALLAFQNINPNRMLSLENIHRLTAPAINNITVNNNSLQVLRWKPPDSGYIKINLDASFLKENLQGGIGLILRNFAGKSIGAQGKYFDGGMIAGLEVEELECRAMQEAASWAVSKNFSRVVFELDSEVLIKSINEQSHHVHWRNQSLVLDIKFLLSKISFWKCVSVKREVNSVADKLAKKTIILKGNFEYLNDVPREIQTWVDQDYHVNSIST